MLGSNVKSLNPRARASMYPKSPEQTLFLKGQIFSLGFSNKWISWERGPPLHLRACYSPKLLLELKLARAGQLKLSCHSNHLSWVIFHHLTAQIGSVFQHKDVGTILAGSLMLWVYWASVLFRKKISLCSPPPPHPTVNELNSIFRDSLVKKFFKYW